MDLKNRIKRLDGGRKPCPVCGFPGRPPKDRKVEIIVQKIGVDEDGKPVMPLPLPPRYCSGCGRLLQDIYVKGLQDKPYVRREDGV
jgi:hypothetical protein